MKSYDFYYTVPAYNLTSPSYSVKIRVQATKSNENNVIIDLVNITQVQHKIKNTEWAIRDIQHEVKQLFERRERIADEGTGKLELAFTFIVLIILLVIAINRH